MKTIEALPRNVLPEQGKHELHFDYSLIRASVRTALQVEATYNGEKVVGSGGYVKIVYLFCKTDC